MTETRVYLVSWDVERFQAYLYDLPDEDVSLDDHMLFNGHSKLESWKPLPIYSDQPHLERPDIWYHTATFMPVMSEEVIDQLAPFMSEAGELLPLIVSGTGDEVYMVNVLVVRDAVEPGAYSLDELWAYPRFIEHRLPDTGLFLLPQLSGKIFYVERDDDEETLIGRIEACGLRGMSFVPVWSSTSGPAPLNLFEVV
jgi:hypothetical protein